MTNMNNDFTHYDFSNLLDIDFRVNYYMKTSGENNEITIDLTNNQQLEYLIGKHGKIEFKPSMNYSNDLKKYLNLLKINGVGGNNDNFLMKWKPGDVSYGLDDVTIVKSRPITGGDNSIILPLNYVRHYPPTMIKIAQTDPIPFQNKIPTAVWRGVTTGYHNAGIRNKYKLPTYIDLWEKHEENYNDLQNYIKNDSIPSRFNLVNKYHNNPVVNVGFSAIVPDKIKSVLSGRRFKVKGNLTPKQLLK